MATINTTNNWQTWKPEIDTYIQDELATQPKMGYENIFTIQSSTRLQNIDLTRSGYGPMVEVEQDGDAIEDAPLEGYKSVYQGRNFRKSASFSSDLFETDQQQTVEDLARGLVTVVTYTRNLNVYSMFRQAFNPTMTFGDSRPLVSTSHPLKNGMGTQSNTFSDGVQRELTYDNVVALRNVQRQVVSNSGNLMNLASVGRNMALIVAKPLEEQAFQIAGVKGPDGKPFTMDNDKNFIKLGANFNVIVLDFVSYEAAFQAGEITSARSSAANIYDTMWGIIDLDAAKRYFKMYYRKGYENGQFDDEKIKRNQVLVKYAYDKYAWGNSGWFPVVMSKGDNSTYTG